MKKLFLPIVICLLALTGGAQTSASFSIDPSFMLTANFKGSSEGDWIHKVTQLQVMVMDGKQAADARQWSKLSHDLRDQRFEDLFSIRKGNDRLQLMSKDGRQGLKEIAFLAGDGDGGLFIRFAGKFTQHDLDEMQSSLRDNKEQ
ncbi:DUF4252 domain-containing protein [Flavitalea sp. BT771]|uniref:DUF4252 domain-containing protein n=1 Tax=Flavitalea sp. BT771 TaxID=3063329 RepID=UPI0026E1BE7C|nr:DUF4252 domain-containing protein [Flavitalea sp. BT771]MDO6430500.1 DUF4252 domain-containing protein [Flavitalea sp. BT771]MDV6219360.1 DUF4252 domain-containing protein [Flavitalea sp. BT771]